MAGISSIAQHGDRARPLPSLSLVPPFTVIGDRESID